MTIPILLDSAEDFHGLAPHDIALILALVAIIQILLEVMRRFVFKDKNGTPEQLNRLVHGCSNIVKSVDHLIESEHERQRYLDKVTVHMSETKRCNEKMSEQLSELHDWHDHDDPDEPGVKVWYVRKALTTAVEANTAAIRELTRIIKAKFPNNGGR